MRIVTGVFSAAILAISISTMMGAPSAMACNNRGNCANAPGQVKGAPGPIAGAGLPILAVGYGVYWLVRRRRNAS